MLLFAIIYVVIGVLLTASMYANHEEKLSVFTYIAGILCFPIVLFMTVLKLIFRALFGGFKEK